LLFCGVVGLKQFRVIRGAGHYHLDYGIGQDLRKAMAIYLQSGGQGSPIVNIKEAIAGMKEKFEIIGQMFNGFDHQILSTTYHKQ
jgi:hypothetical protein